MMIQPCFCFDEEVDSIVDIPTEQDPKWKVHEVRFGELKKENIEDMWIRITWRWNNYTSGLFSMSISAHNKLTDGRYAATYNFGDGSLQNPINPDRVGSSQHTYEDMELWHYGRGIALFPKRRKPYPLPLKPWIYDINKTMINDKGIGKMQKKWRRRHG